MFTVSDEKDKIHMHITTNCTYRKDLMIDIIIQTFQLDTSKSFSYPTG